MTGIMYDAAHIFRALGSVALTASEVVGEVDLDKLTTSVGAQRDKLGAQGYQVVIEIEEFDVVTADDPNAVPPTVAESYSLSIETGPTGATDVTHFTHDVVKTGRLVIPLDAQSVEKADANHDVIAIRLTAAGDAPSIKFAAWIV